MALDLTDSGMETTSSVDYKLHPEQYRTGAAEGDILNVEPYASELLPYLHFQGERSALHAAQVMYDTFMRYREQDDFVGMDMARKCLEMGWMQTRHYAANVSNLLDARFSKLPARHDLAMAGAAKMFHRLLQRARSDESYLRLKEKHRASFERGHA